MNYDQPTPETDAFMLLIDDSEVDLGQIESKLKKLECERNEMTARAVSLALYLPPETLAGEVQRWRDNVKVLLAGFSESQREAAGLAEKKPVSMDRIQDP